MDRPSDIERARRYHDGTKHRFDRFAQSPGFLDWASQPRPFRSFDGAPSSALYPAPQAPAPAVPLPRVTYDSLFDGKPPPAAPVTAASIGAFLRGALGLSAWKAIRHARWPLRVNPSSGNLHPTEAYVVVGPLPDFGGTPGVWHYTPDRHALERRCAFEPDAWRAAGMAGMNDASQPFLVALSSIHWRESWKYGERAFRYCQHDLGHAIAALRLSAAACGWRAALLPRWPHRAVAAIAGLDRDEDYADVEREEPGCMLIVSPGADAGAEGVVPAALLDAVRSARWFGRPSQLSEDHVRWSFIDDVAAATEDPGRVGREGREARAGESPRLTFPDRGLDAAAVILQRRSALAFDGASAIDRESFLRMLSRALPGPDAPWDALWWSPRLHLALFVHRVNGLVPGLYLLVREDAAGTARTRLASACRRDFAWTRADAAVPLWLLREGDYRELARRVSCDQDIAADGFFSLGMLADFDRSLEEEGASFYRHLFWESGVIGQVLYLEAEAAGARATGIGCFFDDPVHALLGLEGHAFQSLYHFTIGMPVDDARLTTEPGYAWEGQSAPNVRSGAPPYLRQ